MRVVDGSPGLPRTRVVMVYVMYALIPSPCFSGSVTLMLMASVCRETGEGGRGVDKKPPQTTRLGTSPVSRGRKGGPPSNHDPTAQVPIKGT